MFGLSVLLTRMADAVCSTPELTRSNVGRLLDADMTDAGFAQTGKGDFILSDVRIEGLPGAAGVIVARSAMRSLVITPVEKGAWGVFVEPPLPGGEVIESGTGLGFVWRTRMRGVIVGVSAGLPDRTIQTIFCDDDRS